MINIRQEMKKILRGWGHDVYLQRWKNNKYAPDIEKYTVRYTYPRLASLSNTQSPKREGLVQDVDLLYFFSWDANPREGDRIYEEDPRFASNHTMWKIKYALAMRGRGGRIEYWVCGANRELPT